MIDNMPEKTGKKLTEWLEILAKTNFEKHSLAVNFLKKEHGVSHGFANTIVTLSKDKNTNTEDLVINQYIGKASLKPLYDMLISIIKQFGDDVVIAPKKVVKV